jgi:2-succinyl-6-hydroxy-2,4-cyclohexadiene-1-carboxylate synthase
VRRDERPGCRSDTADGSGLAVSGGLARRRERRRTIRRIEVGDEVVEVAEHAPFEAAGPPSDDSSRCASATGAPTGVGGRLPLLLLHGFAGDKSSFDDLAARLASGRRVVVPDLPGHGGTQTPDVPDRCTFEHTATLLRAVLGRLGIARLAIAGYSMGGRLALHLALARPQAVERLVLVSASAGLAHAEERAARRRADEELAAFIETHPIAAFVERWERLPLFATERALPAAVRAARRRQRLGCRAAGLAASLRGMGTGAQPWLGDRLGEVRASTLVVAGARDVKFTGIARALADALPRAELGLVADAGHAVHVEQPALLAALMETFLHRQEDIACRSTG